MDARVERMLQEGVERRERVRAVLAEHPALTYENNAEVARSAFAVATTMDEVICMLHDLMEQAVRAGAFRYLDEATVRASIASGVAVAFSVRADEVQRRELAR